MNNTEVSDEEIMEANRTYGGLGELAILVLPQNQVICSVSQKIIIRAFDLKKLISDFIHNPQI